MHHLQTYYPGSPFYAAGYAITNIVVTQGGGPQGLNLATVTCPINPRVDCSWYAGGPVYIAGNSEFNAQNQNQIQTTVACATNPCQGTNQLTFGTTVAPGTYTGGTVWSPNYWPLVLPFGTLQGATAFEVYECDLDYGYLQFELVNTGLYQPIYQTTNWAQNDGGAGGCADWGIPGPDNNYSGAIANALNY